MAESVPDHPQSVPHVEKVPSPFDGAKSLLSATPTGSVQRRAFIWATIAAVIVGAVLFWQYIFTDPLRTLREFPVRDYYENHIALEGTSFRADCRVIAQLGWNSNLGRLINCTLGSEQDPVVLLVPEKFRAIPLMNGDRFNGELTVVDGGLVTVTTLKVK